MCSDLWRRDIQHLVGAMSTAETFFLTMAFVGAMGCLATVAWLF